jgi:DNA polymerase-2
MARSLDGFVLTRGWRDTPQGLVLTYWLATDEGPLRVRITKERAVMFVERGTEAEADHRRELELRTLWDKPVDALYFHHQRSLRQARDRLREVGAITLESDVKPSERFLMERFVTGACRITGVIRQRGDHLTVTDPKVKSSDYEPTLRALALDIETDGERGPVISVGFVDHDGSELCLMVGGGQPPPGAPALRFVPDERSLLERSFDEIRRRDPDVLLGWNVVEFDLSHLLARAEALDLRFAIGRGGERATVLEPRSATQLPIPRIPGRAVLDGIATLRTATYNFESFALQNVAQELLGQGKTIEATGAEKIAEIRRQWREDPAALASYNLEDCRLVKAIVAETDLVHFAMARQRMTGLSMSRAGGSVAAFDHLYLPRLHRMGHVAGEIGAAGGGGLTSPGGYVLASRPGLYRNVLVLDFKSLYPSIIRTFAIDPLGLAFPGDDPVQGFDGAEFHRDRHILPGLIEELWSLRDEAKRAQDQASSQAIKILMNSFYGVLGTAACRFFNPRLASSITRRGHEIITRSRDWLEGQQREVIYGDTDSLFVALDPTLTLEECLDEGRRLAAELNAWWRDRVADEHRVTSRLEVEFEVCYRRFFMPTLRGSDEGSAKRYAGLVHEGDHRRLVVKGLEAVRTDWTPLARRFQRELLRRVFDDEPFESWMRELRQSLLAGELDGELIYRKRMRRGVEEYTRNLPPHVRAAQMLERPGKVIRYVITTRGPEPIEKLQSPIDHHHYLERQLAPAANGILGCLGTSFTEIAGDQLALF